jgi:hypothetical protein
MELRLPPGYHLELDADVAHLRREDGRSVAVFSARGVVWETVERAAWEDHRGKRSPAEASGRRPTPTLGRPPSRPHPHG